MFIIDVSAIIVALIFFTIVYNYIVLYAVVNKMDRLLVPALCGIFVIPPAIVWCIFLEMPAFLA